MWEAIKRLRAVGSGKRKSASQPSCIRTRDLYEANDILLFSGMKYRERVPKGSESLSLDPSKQTTVPIYNVNSLPWSDVAMEIIFLPFGRSLTPFFTLFRNRYPLRVCFCVTNSWFQRDIARHFKTLICQSITYYHFTHEEL